MIRLNLLPFRTYRKRENIRRQVSVFFLTILFLLSLIAYLWLGLNAKAEALKAQKHHKEEEAVRYGELVKKIEELKKESGEAKLRIKVIQRLEKARRGPVQLLKEIALAVPPDRLWLRNLVQSEAQLTLEGSAMDNDTVALFMTNLEKTQSIASVNLKSVSLKYLPQHKVNVSEFVLSCWLQVPGEPQPELNARRQR